MSPYIKLYMETDSDSDLWVEVRSAPDEAPVVERLLNLNQYVLVEDSDISIGQKILLLALRWYERTINLAANCEKALRWSGRALGGIPVDLLSINIEKVEWRYIWKRKPHTNAFSFNQYLMCIDWVGDEGLTSPGREFILSAVAMDVECLKRKNSPEYIRIQSLIKEFREKFPAHESFRKEASAALSAIHPYLPFSEAVHAP